MTSRQPVAYDDNPLVSVIVVNHNGKHFLEECLTSVENSNYSRDKYEIILVDNASSDSSVEFTTHKFPRVRILKLDKNYGFCKPNNEGVKIARGQYIVLLNNDTVVTREWLPELIRGVSSAEKVVCCASKILYYDRKDMINAAGGKITITGAGFYRGYGDKDGPKYDRLEYTGFGCGAGVLVKRDFFISIGGFDEDYFASCEEHDLGWKSWLFGYKVLYVPSAVMYHKESGTFGGKGSYQPVKVYLITRNRLYNLIKNFEKKNVMRGLFISLAFDIYRGSRYIISGNFGSAKSISRAYLDFIKNLGKMLERRRLVQQNRRVSDDDLYKLGVVATFAESLSEERRLRRVLRGEFYTG